MDLRKFTKQFGDKEKIKFYSNRTDFKVTLMNENYNREIENTSNKSYTENYKGKYTENYTENINETQRKIINLIKSNPNITQKIMMEKINLSRPAITLNLKQLKDKKIIERVGSDRKGYWKIVNIDKK